MSNPDIFKILRESREEQQATDKKSRMDRVRKTLNESSNSRTPTRTSSKRSLMESLAGGERRFLKECSSCFKLTVSPSSTRSSCTCGGLYETRGEFGVEDETPRRPVAPRVTESRKPRPSPSRGPRKIAEAAKSRKARSLREEDGMEDDLATEEQVREVLDILEVPEDIVAAFDAEDYEEVSEFLHDEWGLSLDAVEEEIAPEDEDVELPAEEEFI